MRLQIAVSLLYYFIQQDGQDDQYEICENLRNYDQTALKSRRAI